MSVRRCDVCEATEPCEARYHVHRNCPAVTWQGKPRDAHWLGKPVCPHCKATDNVEATSGISCSLARDLADAEAADEEANA